MCLLLSRRPGYESYDTKHPNVNARVGTSLLINRHHVLIKHHEIAKIDRDFVQTTTIVFDYWYAPIGTSAVYCPPPNVTEPIMKDLKNSSNLWAQDSSAGVIITLIILSEVSRLYSPRSQNLQAVIQDKQLGHHSTGEPIY